MAMTFLSAFSLMRNDLFAGTLQLRVLYAKIVRTTRPVTAPAPSSAPTHALSVRDVDFSYRDSEGNEKHILKAVSFDIPAGAKVGLLGRSGSGKSTLLKLLARLYQPTSGGIFMSGQSINDVLLDEHALLIEQQPEVWRINA